MIVAFLALGMLVQDPPLPGAVLDDVVVTHAREARPPYDVAGDFMTYCYDANRLEGRARSPEGVGLWEVLDRESASRLGLSSTGQAYMLDSERIKLVLLIEEGSGPGSRRQHSCTLTAMGGHDPRSIESDMARLMGRSGASGFTRHSDIFPTFEGWRQTAWSAIPQRGSRDWRVFGDSPESFVVAIAPRFYSRSSWVVTEFRSREDEGVPTSAIKLTYFFRP